MDSSRYLCARISLIPNVVNRSDEFAPLTLSHNTLIDNSRKFVYRHQYVILINSLNLTTHSTRTNGCRSTVLDLANSSSRIHPPHRYSACSGDPQPPTTESTLFLQHPQALSKQPHTNRLTHARPHSQSTRRHM